MTRIAQSQEIVLKDESYAIAGACFAVYNDKGRGFLDFGYYPGLEYERLVTKRQEPEDFYL